MEQSEHNTDTEETVTNTNNAIMLQDTGQRGGRNKTSGRRRTGDGTVYEPLRKLNICFLNVGGVVARKTCERTTPLRMRECLLRASGEVLKPRCKPLFSFWRPVTAF